MEQIKLNKEIPEIEFKLNSVDSYIRIQRVFVTSPEKFEKEWTNFLSQVTLIAELKYVVFNDSQQQFIDERKIQYPINLPIDPYQVQPLIQLDRLIKNESFTVGINANRQFYSTLKLKLQEAENLDSDYTLEFFIEKHKIAD